MTKKCRKLPPYGIALEHCARLKQCVVKLFNLVYPLERRLVTRGAAPFRVRRHAIQHGTFFDGNGEIETSGHSSRLSTSYRFELAPFSPTLPAACDYRFTLRSYSPVFLFSPIARRQSIFLSLLLARR